MIWRLLTAQIAASVVFTGRRHAVLTGKESLVVVTGRRFRGVVGHAPFISCPIHGKVPALSRLRCR